MPAQATPDANKWSQNIAKDIRGRSSFPTGLTEPLYYVKPAGAPHGHDDFTILAMPTGAEQLIQSKRYVNID